MLQSDLTRIDEADLLRLVSDSASESSTLEFKVQPHGTDIDQKVELAKDVSAMANADGGDIVFGLAEDQHVASRLVGISGEAYDPLVRRITQTLDAKVEPRVEGIRFHKVEMAGGGYAVVMRIPRSFKGPHSVRSTQELRRFVYRNGTSVSDMSFDQVRSAFDRTATLAERARAFIEERHQAIHTGHTPRRLVSEVPLLVLHIVPIASVAGGHLVNLKSLYHGPYDRLQGAWEGCSRTLNFDGLTVHAGAPANEPQESYTHAFRSGAIEAVRAGGWTWTLEGHPVKIVHSSTMAKFFRDGALQFMRVVVGTFNLSGPAVVSFAVFRASGRRLALRAARSESLSDRTPDRDHLVVPLAWVEDIGSCQIDEIARPALDMLAQAFGVAGSDAYDSTTGAYVASAP